MATLSIHVRLLSGRLATVSLGAWASGFGERRRSFSLDFSCFLLPVTEWFIEVLDDWGFLSFYFVVAYSFSFGAMIFWWRLCTNAWMIACKAAGTMTTTSTTSVQPQQHNTQTSTKNYINPLQQTNNIQKHHWTSIEPDETKQNAKPNRSTKKSFLFPCSA